MWFSKKLSVTCHGGEISIAGEDVFYSQLLKSAPQVNLLLHFEPEKGSLRRSLVTHLCHISVYVYIACICRLGRLTSGPTLCF